MDRDQGETTIRDAGSRVGMDNISDKERSECNERGEQHRIDSREESQITVHELAVNMDRNQEERRRIGAAERDCSSTLALYVLTKIQGFSSSSVET